MAFQRFEKKGGRHSDPRVSISVAGQISLNRSTIDKYFKSKKFVHLYFDKEKNYIGVKSADNEADDAFKLTSNEIQSNSSFSAISFLKHYGIDYKNTKQYIPSWNDKDEMLIIKVGQKD